MFVRVVALIAVLASAVNCESLRKEEVVVVKDAAALAPTFGRTIKDMDSQLPAGATNNLKRLAAKTKAEKGMKVEAQHFEVEATPTGWYYATTYGSTTCSANAGQQEAYISGYCYNDGFSSWINTCDSAGAMTMTTYTDTACATVDETGAVTFTCDAMTGMTIAGAAAYQKWSCGATGGSLSTLSNSGILSTYTAAACTDSTQIYSAQYAQDTCMGFTTFSMLISEPSVYTYVGATCTGASTAVTQTVNTCAANDDSDLTGSTQAYDMNTWNSNSAAQVLPFAGALLATAVMTVFMM